MARRTRYPALQAGDGNTGSVRSPGAKAAGLLMHEVLHDRNRKRKLTRKRVVSKALRAYAQSVSSADKGGVRIIG